MAQIFISYRRADSRLVANRIYDRLVGAFGKRNVFKDVDNIPPGRDFRGVLREATANCQVMLVIIGPNWLNATDASGNRRLDDPTDFVRLEVEAGLQRDNIRVIPVLVENANIPHASELPNTLKEFVYNNAIVIQDDPNFHRDMDRLIVNIRPLIRRMPSFHFDWRWVVGVILIPIIVALMQAIIPVILNQDNTNLTPQSTTAIAQAKFSLTPPITPITTPRPTETSSYTSTANPTEVEMTIAAEVVAISAENTNTAIFIQTQTATALTPIPTVNIRATAEARATLVQKTTIAETIEVYRDTPTATTEVFDRMPDPAWIYHFIKFTDNERAGNMRWIESWDTLAESDRQIVMIDAQGGQHGVEYSCQYGQVIDGNSTIYLKDDEPFPVAETDQLFRELQNWTLINQSELYVTGRECQPLDTSMINNVPAQKCIFENQDATNLFLIRPPATSNGELWTAIDGGYPVSYHFSAMGANGTVEHQYEFLQPPSDFSIDVQPEVKLQCFDESFPLPPNTTPVVGGLNFAVFKSTNSIATLQSYYDEQLDPIWTGSGPHGNRTYKRSLNNGMECSVTIKLAQGFEENTFISADVYPDSANVETFELPNNLASLPVLQPRLVTFSIIGSVQDAIDQVVPSLEATGWVQRLELTDIRDNSAFITLTNEAEGVEMHIIIDFQGTTSTISLQTRDPVCGPTFDH